MSDPHEHDRHHDRDEAADRGPIPDAGRPGGDTDDVVDGDVAANDHEPDRDLSEAEHAIEGDIAEVAAERDSFKDIALRLQADFDNYRKRVAAQTADQVDRATGSLVEALLPVLDATEAAYLRHPDEIGPIFNVMLSELRKQGLETLDLEGRPFDPEVAEAVAHEPGDGGEAIVADVMRSGYRWKGRTLRAAMVRTRG